MRRRHEKHGDGGRTQRLQELIREELNFLLRCEVTDAQLQGIAVTFVSLAEDGSCARIWFTSERTDDQIAALERAAGFLRSHLAESLALKRTPDLRFCRDPVSRLLSPSSNNET